jgi:pimeloyl-ACP methyl ester carboxylesterase
LAGHSYGGAVITNAAVGDPEVRALVYVDAFIPDQGETLGGLLASVPGSCLAGNPADIFNLVPYPGSPPGDIDTYIKPSLVPGCFASGLPASQAAVIAATQRPLAASTLSEPSGTPAWKTIPSWAVIGTADKVIPPALLLSMAQRARARITTVNAGHLSLISNPGVVTQVIIKSRPRRPLGGHRHRPAGAPAYPFHSLGVPAGDVSSASSQRPEQRSCRCRGNLDGARHPTEAPARRA